MAMKPSPVEVGKSRPMKTGQGRPNLQSNSPATSQDVAALAHTIDRLTLNLQSLQEQVTRLSSQLEPLQTAEFKPDSSIVQQAEGPVERGTRRRSSPDEIRSRMASLPERRSDIIAAIRGESRFTARPWLRKRGLSSPSSLCSLSHLLSFYSLYSLPPYFDLYPYCINLPAYSKQVRHVIRKKRATGRMGQLPSG